MSPCRAPAACATPAAAGNRGATPFSSSGSIRFSSPRITAGVLTIDSNGRTYGVSDTAELSASSSAGSHWSGSLRPSNGVTYSF